MRVVVFKEGTLQVVEGEPRPVPSSDDLLVRVHACVVTQPDIRVLRLYHDLKGIRGIAVGSHVAGVVEEVGPGAEAAGFVVGDKVAGVIAPDAESGGYAEHTLLSCAATTKVPEGVELSVAAASLPGGIQGYAAFQYLSKLTPGAVVAVANGSSLVGTTLIQLAASWGARVLGVASTVAEAVFLRELDGVSEVIDLSTGHGNFIQLCMEATHGLGVDVIVDGGVLAAVTDTERCLPSKHDIITCLAAGGKWVTSAHDLQLDPPDSQVLFFKQCSLGFLCEQAWVMSGAHQGRLLHILADLMAKVESKAVVPTVSKVLSLSEVPGTVLETLTGAAILQL